MTSILTILRVRRHAAADWTAADTVLEDGQLGFETDTRKFKLGDGTTEWTALAYAGAGVGDALLADGLDQFAATSSAELATVISDETGTGLLVFNNGATFIGPILGTPASGTLTNCSGLPAAGVSGVALVAAAIGTTVQAFDAFLTSIAALGTAANKMLYTTAANTAAETDITAAARGLLDDADAQAQRKTLNMRGVMLAAALGCDMP